MKKLRENINAELARRQWNPYDLERESGVPQPTIQRFLAGKHKELKNANIEKIANAFGMQEAQLRGIDYENQHAPTAISEQCNHYANLSAVPIVGIAQLGDNGYWTELEYPEGFGDGHINYPTSDRNAYALRCSGDSMKPRIKNGEFVIIEPNTTAQPGDEVLVKAKDGRVMIKVFLYQRDGNIHLMSINETHAPQSIELKNIEKIHPVAAIIKSSNWIKNIT